ncbi:hypothetical protein U0070_015040 [Myodes glareolus]|uniref:Uncharacterized protein n=1 Tax=Myodes glareolus TaxID=447135 RepID=A0AAW0HXR6_MYOGA
MLMSMARKARDKCMNEQRVNDANVKKAIRQALEAEMNWGVWAPQVPYPSAPSHMVLHFCSERGRPPMDINKAQYIKLHTGPTTLDILDTENGLALPE